MGIDPQIDERTLDAAWKMAFSRLQTVATGLQSDIVALYNFNQYRRLPEEKVKKFNMCPFDLVPNCRLILTGWRNT